MLTMSVLPASAATPAAPDFDYFYSSALKAHEQVAIQESRLEQAEADFRQVRGGLFPSISLLGSYSRQDTSSNSGGSLSAFRLADQWNSRINLTQPLFRGLAEYAELSARSWEVDAQKATLFETRRSLYNGIAQAYYDVLANRQDLVNVRAMRKLTQERVSELQQRSKIGRSRSGEVLAAQAQLVALDSQLEGNELLVRQSENRLSIQSGTAVPEEIESLEASEKRMPKTLPPLDQLEKKLESRPDIVALQAQEKASSRRVGVARGGHFPTLDFSANYYLKRTGALDGVKWDLGVTLVFPLFQGGAVMAAVDSAVETQKRSTLQLAQTVRTARLDLRNAYDTLQSTFKQIAAWEKSVDISERNYKEQKRDYSLGLATNVEVLQALNSFQELQRNLDRSRAQRLSAWASLKAIAGDLP